MNGNGAGPVDITVFGSFAPAGGVQNRLALMIPHWVRHGLTVEVVVFRGGQLFHARELEDLVSVRSIPARHKLVVMAGLARYLLHRRPRVVLSSARIPNVINLAAHLLARREGAVVCVTNPPGRSGAESARWYKQRRAKLRWIRWLYPHARGIIAISEGVKRDLVALTGLPGERIEVVYNGILSPVVRARAAEPVEHPWFDDGAIPVLVSAGRLAPQKDYPTLIRAFARLRRDRAARLLILGEGPDRRLLEDLVKTLDLSESIHLPGHVQNPYGYMVRAAAFVMASRWEGFGNVIAEALCLGTPVVATDCPGGPREILGDGRWGHLVPPGDETALAAAMAASLREGRSGPAPALTDHCARFEARRAALEYLRVMGFKAKGREGPVVVGPEPAGRP